MNFQIFEFSKFSNSSYVLPDRSGNRFSSTGYRQKITDWVVLKFRISKGASGHSDADVLLHAICDALLGALNLGDIGIHFPDTDKSLKDIDSKILLEKTFRLIREKGYSIVNLDTVVCLEKPKIMAYARAMREVMAGILEISRRRYFNKGNHNGKARFYRKGRRYYGSGGSIA